MKTIHTLATLAITCLAFTACEKKADTGAAASSSSAPVVDEKTAIANFKTEVEAAVKWMEEKQKTTQTDPVAGMAAMGEMIGKFKAVKTDGLPADLKGAWGEMTGVLGEMGDIFKGLPTAQPANPEDAMKAVGELMPKLMAMQGKIEPVAKKLEELGKKYGLDLSKVGGK